MAAEPEELSFGLWSSVTLLLTKGRWPNASGGAAAALMEESRGNWYMKKKATAFLILSC